MKHLFTLLLSIIISSIITNNVYAFEINPYNAPEIHRAYGKQQIKTKDSKGNTILITPDYSSYAERNQKVSEKIVAIYDKRSPAYGYRYVLYKPIGSYVGHHKILQPSLNGYGYDPVPDGDPTGVASKTPCFKTIQEAKHYYYPQWYK